MNFSEIFEHLYNSQNNDLLFSNESDLENEIFQNDCPIFEQLKVNEEYPLELFNLKDKKDISLEKESLHSGIKKIFSIQIPNEETDNSIKITEAMIKRKRGKSSLKNNENIHTRMKNDNRLAKIQGSYLSFIIKFLNEIMEKMNLDYKFVDFDFSIKTIIKKCFRKELKNKTIKDIILEIPISSKNSKHNINHNKNGYKKLYKENQYIILNILEKNYLYFFEKIYYKNCRKLNLRDFDLNDFEIELSKKVKTFEDLLNKDGLDKYSIAIDSLLI